MPNDDLQIPPPPFVPISLAVLAAAAGVDPEAAREVYRAAREWARTPSDSDAAKPHLWN
jgi:hypothetical protein